MNVLYAQDSEGFFIKCINKYGWCIDMAILTTELICKWYPMNRKYYESKGYVFTKWHDEFIVCIDDMPPNAEHEVDVECDVCGLEFTKTYIAYYRETQKNGGLCRCKSCANKSIADEQKYEYEDVKAHFADEGYELVSPNYKDSKSPLEYKCKIHGLRTITYAQFRTGRGCLKCGAKRRGEEHSGENNWNYQGGITQIKRFLRDGLTQWKDDSKKNCNFKCVISGGRFDVIHHLYSFQTIAQEAIDESGIDIKDEVNKYTQEELDILSSKILAKHYEYPLGVCLTKEIHDLFHHIYGFINNTMEQFDEFKIRYLAGEFDG